MIDWPYLTPTERRVAELIRDGLNYREIAAELKITRKTVGVHATNLYGKMRAAGEADPRGALRGGR